MPYSTPLNRAQLIDLAVTKYFEGCNQHNFDQVVNTFAEDCLMWFPASSFRYQGIDALRTHFNDFLSTFETIDFRDFTNIVDVDTQSLVSYFTVQLINHKGDETLMKNCNVFHIGEDGLFNEIIIYNSKPLSEGFEAGNS